jgi:hypothetical protein
MHHLKIPDREQELQQLEARRERLQKACGCESGAWAMLLALVLYVVYLA